MIVMGAVKLFHKVFLLKKPPAIAQYIQQSMISTESVSFVRYNSIKRPPKSVKTSRSLFHKATEIYNSIKLNLKILEPKVFNKRIKSYIRSNVSPDRIP